MTAILIAVALSAAVLLLLTRPERIPPRGERYPTGPPELSVPFPPLEVKAIVVIIDDMGHSRIAAEPFLDLEYPLTLSFLPHRPHSAELAEEAFRRGKTVLMHLPMEPKGYPDTDPGQGAILLSMENHEITRVLEEDLKVVPRAVGFNNHMGSKATEDRRVMSEILRLARDRGLIFIDSRTSPDSVGFALASAMDVPTAERSVFLDNIQTAEAIDEQADRLLDDAEERGWAIGIGHPYVETAAALGRLASEAEKRGILWISLEEGLDYAGPRH
ncbi:MAG: divergent polysaccharide deacetylase family protein [bacterium]|nr:MAG: divergent polysaccharide deacetylase family protein [bacterium]